MDTNQLYLFKDKRFLPIFIVQFCGCLNDNILKNALIILITYKLANSLEQSPQLLVLLANALFVLPFVLFASIAGQLADKYERVFLVRAIKVVEIGIVLLAVYGFSQNNLFILFSCITLMGVHSTFFGPLKYSVLPDHLQKDELLGGNGYVEAGTFVSILIGTIIGGFYNSGADFVIFVTLVIAVIGLVSSFFMPLSNNSNSDVKVSFNIIRENINILKYSYSKKQVFLSILGISWFWFIGAAILAQIPSLTKDILGADENVANLFLATFSLGVGVGSFWCNKIFENEITTKYVFISAIGISLFGIDLFFASQISAVSDEPEQLKSIVMFLSKKHNWRIVVDLFFLAAIGGLYVVPLFAVMQYFSSPAYRSRVIAANNLINSFFMAVSTVLLSLLFKLNFSIPFVILLVSLLNIVVAYYIYDLLPEARIIPEGLLRSLFKFVFDKLYKVQVRGLENFHKAGKRSVIVANHISYLDPALLAVYLPEKLTFAINTGVAEAFWVKPFLRVVKTFSIDPNNSMATKALISEVKKNKKIAIFPEGRISITGALMKIYEGPGMIADKADATILPIRIDGPQFTHFSKLKHLFGTKVFTKITITILPPVKLDAPADLDSRQRRKYISHKLYDIMSEMIFESSDYKKTLFQSVIDAARVYGYKREIAQDIDNNKVSYRQLLLKSFVLGDLMSKDTKPGENVGLMLPNSVGAMISFYAMQSIGLVPTMINFTSGINNIISACNTAKVSTIYTARKFIERAELHELVEKLSQHVNIIYLEDLRQQVNLWIKLKSLIGSIFPQIYYNTICKNQEETAPAVVLFTSGTEGQPKAVVLSHRNIQANRCQVLARVDFGLHDLAFNALPMFHTFGMTASVLMTLTGIKTFFYPSPLHYRIIPEVIYDIGATIMFGADTFLNGYSKYAHPYDFYSLRYVFAGAEKLKSETRKTWFDKYGVRIFEGYGVTETAPVIAANTPMHDKPGTVGRFMPKVEHFIQPVEGIPEGGRLCVKGPNVMLGYMMADNPGVIVPPAVEKLGTGWYDTGDIVKVDEDGYITILGRAKRFAKIAGEMVSLSAVEEVATKIDAENLHAAVHIADEKKGEQILLYTTSNLVTKDKLVETVKRAGISELYIPKEIILIDEIPILATGKVDYRRIVEMAEEYTSKQKKLAENNELSE